MSSSPTSSSSFSLDDPLQSMFDVKCRVDIVLGTATMSMRDCLKLERHSLLRLKQSAGADLELRAQGVTVATGEVVILEDNTALRISRVSPPVGVESA